MVTLISSFYNEEYLLPWWLEHHRDIFEHGVLFDYHSTDDSAKLVETLCPSWEVRKTKHEKWNPVTNDEEFKEAEWEFSGYKMTLTTTEFLVGKEPDMTDKPTCYSIPIIRMVDNKPYESPTYDKPLVEQKTEGYLDKSPRKRFLHNYLDGQYATGRDRTSLPTQETSLFVAKYTLSPHNNETIERRLRMKDLMDKQHLENKNWGRQHKLNREQLVEEYHAGLANKGLKDYKEVLKWEPKN